MLLKSLVGGCGFLSFPDVLGPLTLSHSYELESVTKTSLTI